MNRKAVFTVMILAAAALFLAGCFSPYHGNEAIITINLGSGSERMVFDWPPEDFLEDIDYVVTFTGNGENITVEAKGGQTIRCAVPPGVYTIKVDAYLEGLRKDGKVVHYATGSASAEAKSGRTTLVTIKMHQVCNCEGNEDDCICGGDACDCESCGEIDPNCDHAWYWVVTENPTVDKEGLKTETCIHCGAKSGNTQIIDKIDPDHIHDSGKWHITLAATCTQPGSEQLRCTCEYVLDEIEIPVLEHKLIPTDVVDATCEEDGNIKYWECSVCYKLFSDENGETELAPYGIVIEAIGHDYQWKQTDDVTIKRLCTRDPEHIDPATKADAWQSLADLLGALTNNVTPPGNPPYTIVVNIEDKDDFGGDITESGSLGNALVTSTTNSQDGVINSNTTVTKNISLDLSGGTFTDFPTGASGGAFGASVWEGNSSNIKCGVLSLRSVILPNTVREIGGAAFQNCDNLTSINIPEGVKSIGNYAFQGGFGNQNTNIEISGEIDSVGDFAFSGCYGLKGDLTITESIGDGAFSGCSGLTGITIGDGVTSIGSSAFSGCTGLTSITIPDSVTSIGAGAFSGCTGLMEITIPDSVTDIGSSAFFNCSSLESVTIPDGVTSIGAGAFLECTSLTKVTFKGDDVINNFSSVFLGGSELQIAYEKDKAGTYMRTDGTGTGSTYKWNKEDD